MNSDKQIDEMAKTMLEASQNANVEPVLEMEGKEVVLGENATKILNNILEQAYIPFLAEKLTDKGYHKASEVAREIFEEIENSIANLEYRANTPRKTVKVEELKAQCDWILHEVLPKTLAELKKKYTEEGK